MYAGTLPGTLAQLHGTYISYGNVKLTVPAAVAVAVIEYFVTPFTFISNTTLPAAVATNDALYTKL
jgi:predicted Na+-dependent transporter